MRRSICEAAEAAADLTDAAVHQRLLRVYVDALEDWGRKPAGFMSFSASRSEGPEDPLWDEARTLVRSLRRDGAPLDDEGQLVIGSAGPVLPIERFDRLEQPRVLLDHLGRIEAGIDADPAAAIGAAKELVESVLKFALDDYSVAYGQTASLTDLYKLASGELGLSRDAVPGSAKGSQTSQRILQNLTTAVQGLAELRNELGIGHGRTTPSPALGRHARLAANAARTVSEFVLETWHVRRDAAQT